MNPHILRIFQREVERQCTFALLAIQDLNSELKKSDEADMDRIWYSIQAFLVAAGNISKLFWPQNQHFHNRGAELRQSLNVGADSPLHPRKFRNHFEHFDERLECWATSSSRRAFVDSNIGPPGLKIRGIDPDDYLRNFDPVGWVIIFRGDSYHLQPVIEAIKKLQAAKQ